METHKKGAKRAVLDKVLNGRASGSHWLGAVFLFGTVKYLRACKSYSVFKFSFLHSWFFADIPSGPYLSPSWATLHKGLWATTTVHIKLWKENNHNKRIQINRKHLIENCQKLRSFNKFIFLSRSTSFTQTWLFMESFLSSYLSSSILQSTDRLTKPVIDSLTCICAVLFIFAIQSQNILGN